MSDSVDGSKALEKGESVKTVEESSENSDTLKGSDKVVDKVSASDDVTDSDMAELAEIKDLESITAFMDSSETATDSVEDSEKAETLEKRTEESTEKVEGPESTKSATPSPTKQDRDTTTKAFMHLAAGKRHMAVGDFTNAVTDLEEACRLMVEVFGESGPECADAYYYYGTALLDLARQEHGVFGMPESEEPSAAEEDSDQKDEDSEKASLKKMSVSDAKMCVHTKSDSNQDKNCILCRVVDRLGEEEKAEENGTEENGVEQKETEDVDASGETAEEEKVPETEENPVEDEQADVAADETIDEKTAEEQAGQEEEEDTDDVTSLQLSWEMLELAKLIFSKRAEEGPEVEKKLGLVYLKLGEVSLESANYSQAVNDISCCLAIRKKNLPPYHRDIAEVNYQLATALEFDKQYDKAISHYNGAIQVLEDKIQYLQEVMERRAAKEKGEEVTGDDGTAAREKDAFYTEEDEIDEIKKLLPEIKEKVSDTKMLKAQYLKTLAQASESGEGSSSGTAAIFQEVILKSDEPSAVSAASPTKPTSNISHLVKKKRKPEDPPEGSAEKKSKVVNGVSSQEKIKVRKEI